jgi:hypothetical protein
MITQDNREEPVLFELKGYNGQVKDVIRGTTKQDINKPKAVNSSIKGGFYVIMEERDRINEIESKYRQVWKKDTKEKREKEIAEIRKVSNWKLRILNEQAKEEEKRIKEKEEMMEAALVSLKTSKKVHNEYKRVKKGRTKGEPVRRSSRIAQKELEKHQCRGCKENQPNQLAHIGPGGCLGEEEF